MPQYALPCPHFKWLVCSKKEAYSERMDGGHKRSGVMIYMAIAILIMFLSYVFVKAFRSSPPEPHAPVHDSK
jgi:hypothetical protein